MAGTLLTQALDHVPAGVARRFRSGSLLARALKPLVDRALPGETVEVTVRSGVAAGARILIDPRVEKYYWTGAYELDVQEYLAANLRAGDTMWDVGAHAGFFTLVAGRLVGPAGVVHAFEPLEANADRVADTAVRNGLESVIVHRCAVAGVDGTATLRRGSSSLTGTIVDGDGAGDVVDAVTLDTLVRRLGAPTLVKLDVEGAESACLAAAGLLRQAGVQVVVEVHDPDRSSPAPPGWVADPIGPRHVALQGAAE